MASLPWQKCAETPANAWLCLIGRGQPGPSLRNYTAAYPRQFAGRMARRYRPFTRLAASRIACHAAPAGSARFQKYFSAISRAISADRGLVMYCLISG
jgi:hypothetical protein